MEDLKTKVKGLVSDDKHLEVDKIFHDWIVSLKVNTVPDEETKKKECNTYVKGNQDECSSSRESRTLLEASLKDEIEELKGKIIAFKAKMKIYKQRETSTTDLALADVKEEIRRVQDGIMRLKTRVMNPQKCDANSENAELIKKLDEVKEFLERLK